MDLLPLGSADRRPLSGRRVRILGVLLAVVSFQPARAQMVLPGAVTPAPAGTVHDAPRAGGARVGRPRPHGSDGTASQVPAPAIVPSVGALAGRTLSLNGGKTQVTFEPHDRSVEVAHLTLSGERISNTRETCQVEAPGTPIAVNDVGRPNGVDRIQLEFPACPIAFDVLDGAVLADAALSVCEFKEANCRVNPVGLWGPQSGDLGPDKMKGIERARAVGEGAVRANYKALVASTKDRPTIMGFARDQAQFSSTREETCRDYAGEGRHGFCAAKLTEAHAAYLRFKLTDALIAKEERIKKKRERNARKH